MSTNSKFTFLFAHGAGADKDSDWMVEMDNLMTKQGIEVIRFNFPYMIKRQADGKRRPPDRQPKLIEAFEAQINEIPEERLLVIGGKSMGGRMASLLADSSDLVNRVPAVICMGFPFHPPGKPDNFRGEHLAKMKIPTLILQGERDTFGTKEEMDGWLFSKQVKVEFLPDGDHSFKPRKKSGFTLEQNQITAADKIGEFLARLK
ncbi:MAG: dienelactone hydrolase family protein [Kangiellaceae bacterium]|nr:dienelactone hydrolase family protein [Kangiellaceae bacterium]